MSCVQIMKLDWLGDLALSIALGRIRVREESGLFKWETQWWQLIIPGETQRQRKPSSMVEAGAGREMRQSLQEDSSLLPFWVVHGGKIICSIHPFINSITFTECPKEINERVPAYHYYGSRPKTYEKWMMSQVQEIKGIHGLYTESRVGESGNASWRRWAMSITHTIGLTHTIPSVWKAWEGSISDTSNSMC